MKLAQMWPATYNFEQFELWSSKAHIYSTIDILISSGIRWWREKKIKKKNKVKSFGKK